VKKKKKGIISVHSKWIGTPLLDQKTK